MQSVRSGRAVAHRSLDYVGLRSEEESALLRKGLKVINTNKKVVDNLPRLAEKQAVVFCDFDGTVTTSDVTDVLLEELAHPDWKIIEERWVNGEIDDCQCMGEQIALIEGNWQKIVGVLDTIKIDPYFKSFIAQCNEIGLPVYIGSNGIDRVVSYILHKEGIQVNGTWSYHLIESDKGWQLEFPKSETRGFCQVQHSIACKCTLLETDSRALSGRENPYKIVIGDSKSDFCWSHKADFVFGKNKLAQYCRERDIDHLSFTDFSHINEYMTQCEIFTKTASS